MKQRKTFASAALTVLLLSASGAAHGASLTTVEVDASGLAFALHGSSAGTHTLTVGGPEGYLVKQDFAAGESPYFSLVGEDGCALAAGLYTWTLTENRIASGGERQAFAERARAQTGRFTVLADGSVANPNALESGFEKTEIIIDDLVVAGNMCVGTACSSGESFGFDSLRLEENNLRMHFSDTSDISGGDFPGNDWRLIANDQTNGGGEFFAVQDADASTIPFKVEAGAPANALYVEDDGGVGFGTSSPAVNAHFISGDTPTVRIEQNGSAGWTPQSWDLAGNDTNFFIRDVTGGSKLPFRIMTGAPNNSVYIDSTGVGLGTASPGQELEIKADGPGLRFTNTGATAGVWDLFINGNNNRFNMTDDPTHVRVPFKVAPGAANNLLRIGITNHDEVAVDGDVVVTGSITPDYVFEPDFELESIAAHAEFMWREKHLPAVPAARANGEGKGVVDLGARSQGALEELEKAHIYIEQLHQRIQAKEDQLAQLTGMLDRVSELEQRILVD